MELLSEDIRKKVLSLMDLKSTAPEGFMIMADQEISAWIDKTSEYCMAISQQMERKVFDIKDADIFFRKILK